MQVTNAGIRRYATRHSDAPGPNTATTNDTVATHVFTDPTGTNMPNHQTNVNVITLRPPNTATQTMPGLDKSTDTKAEIPLKNWTGIIYHPTSEWVHALKKNAHFLRFFVMQPAIDEDGTVHVCWYAQLNTKARCALALRIITAGQHGHTPFIGAAKYSPREHLAHCTDKNTRSHDPMHTNFFWKHGHIVTVGQRIDLESAARLRKHQTSTSCTKTAEDFEFNKLQQFKNWSGTVDNATLDWIRMLKENKEHMQIFVSHPEIHGRDGTLQVKFFVQFNSKLRFAAALNVCKAGQERCTPHIVPSKGTVGQNMAYYTRKDNGPPSLSNDPVNMEFFWCHVATIESQQGKLSHTSVSGAIHGTGTITTTTASGVDVHARSTEDAVTVNNFETEETDMEIADAIKAEASEGEEIEVQAEEAIEVHTDSDDYASAINTEYSTAAHEAAANSITDTGTLTQPAHAIYTADAIVATNDEAATLIAAAAMLGLSKLNSTASTQVTGTQTTSAHNSGHVTTMIPTKTLRNRHDTTIISADETVPEGPPSNRLRPRGNAQPKLAHDYAPSAAEATKMNIFAQRFGGKRRAPNTPLCSVSTTNSEGQEEDVGNATSSETAAKRGCGGVAPRITDRRVADTQVQKEAHADVHAGVVVQTETADQVDMLIEVRLAESPSSANNPSSTTAPEHRTAAADNPSAMTGQSLHKRDEVKTQLRYIKELAQDELLTEHEASTLRLEYMRNHLMHR
jgi:hypothetical protein